MSGHIRRFFVGVGASGLITGDFRPILTMATVTSTGMGIGLSTKVCEAVREPTGNIKGNIMKAEMRTYCLMSRFAHSLANVACHDPPPQNNMPRYY